MEKEISSNVPGDNDLQMLLDGMNKTAGVEELVNKENAISQEMLEFIKENKKHFNTKKYAYVLKSAMGAEEWWGSNLNGDGFSEEDLLKDKAYKTFENGHYFENHKNKDPKASKGFIVFSAYNHKMHRVELLVALDKEKAAADIKILDEGGNFDVSMGTKIDHDVCSICGNKAKKKHEYCTHIKTQLNKIMPDGRKVYMKNKGLKFFDISKVRIGADPTAKTLEKVAACGGKEEKNGEIEKEVSNNGNDVLLKPADFQKLVNKVGKGEKPSNEKEGKVMRKIKEGSFSEAFRIFNQE